MEKRKMMRSNNLWEDAIYALAPFDKETIDLVERKLQLKLPKDYVNLMKIQNGGYLRRNLFKMNEEEIILDELFGISANEAEGILRTIYMREEWGLPENIILLSGDGHSWVFLDYRKNRELPSVSYVDLELGEDYVLAASFTDFIHALYEDESFEEVVQGAEGVYTKEEFERIVEEADNAFALTDGVLYFTEIDCDMAWLIRQVKQIMDIDNEESEFVLPEVLYYLINRVSDMNLTDEAAKALLVLNEKIKDHDLLAVRNYDKKIREVIS